MKPKEFNLGWGESVAVRSAFIETLPRKYVAFDYYHLESLGYPAHEGDPSLIDLTREIIKRNTGNDYKYILMTNGATGAGTIALRSFQTQLEYCIVRPPPYFRLYPGMVKAAGLKIYHWGSSKGQYPATKGVFLIDSLSNPTCEFSNWKRNGHSDPIIWDAVYFGKVYAPGNHPQPEHDILVGSYSKLTGLNGLRVGWIATNDPIIYQNVRTLVVSEYCGISAASTRIIMETAGTFNTKQWESFERNAQFKLDYNREEFSKLEKFFGGTPVSLYGMFYYSEMDEACKKLMTKSNIIWSHGSDLGTSDDFGRFNVGQDIQIVREAVATVLRNDKR